MIQRRFPHLGWAWPRGSLHQLLIAAISPDLDFAYRSAVTWLDQSDIDAASFREHRLLASITTRLGASLSSHAAYPRLVGYQKHLWTRSFLALQDIEPSLRSLSDLGITLIVIRGAASMAAGTTPRRGRLANHIDVLVRPADMESAFRCLCEEGWLVASANGPQLTRAHLDSHRSIKFLKGRFSDFALHRTAYDGSQQNAEDDEAIWGRSVSARYASVDVRVPGPTDRMAMTIGHGGLDGHVHSDWLVDCATTIKTGEIDWTLALDLSLRRRLEVPMAVWLSYLSELGVPVPAEELEKIVNSAGRGGFARWKNLVQAKPRDDFGQSGPPVRWLVNRLRKTSARLGESRPPAETVWRGRKTSVATSSAPFRTAHTLSVPDPVTHLCQLDLRVRIKAPTVARRLEMEINAGWQHIARLRYRVAMAHSSDVVLRFRGPIALADPSTPITVEARPSRLLRGDPPEAMVARYAPLPFQILDAEFSAIPAA